MQDKVNDKINITSLNRKQISNTLCNFLQKLYIYSNHHYRKRQQWWLFCTLLYLGKIFDFHNTPLLCVFLLMQIIFSDVKIITHIFLTLVLVFCKYSVVFTFSVSPNSPDNSTSIVKINKTFPPQELWKKVVCWWRLLSKTRQLFIYLSLYVYVVLTSL